MWVVSLQEASKIAAFLVEENFLERIDSPNLSYSEWSGQDSLSEEGNQASESVVASPEIADKSVVAVESEDIEIVSGVQQDIVEVDFDIASSESVVASLEIADKSVVAVESEDIEIVSGVQQDTVEVDFDIAS